MSLTKPEISEKARKKVNKELDSSLFRQTHLNHIDKLQNTVTHQLIELDPKYQKIVSKIFSKKQLWEDWKETKLNRANKKMNYYPKNALWMAPIEKTTENISSVFCVSLPDCIIFTYKMVTASEIQNFGKNINVFLDYTRYKINKLKKETNVYEVYLRTGNRFSPILLNFLVANTSWTNVKSNLNNNILCGIRYYNSLIWKSMRFNRQFSSSIIDDLRNNHSHYISPKFILYLLRDWFYVANSTLHTSSLEKF